MFKVNQFLCLNLSLKLMKNVKSKSVFMPIFIIETDEKCLE